MSYNKALLARLAEITASREKYIDALVDGETISSKALEARQNTINFANNPNAKITGSQNTLNPVTSIRYGAVSSASPVANVAATSTPTSYELGAEAARKARQALRSPKSAISTPKSTVIEPTFTKPVSSPQTSVRTLSNLGNAGLGVLGDVVGGQLGYRLGGDLGQSYGSAVGAAAATGLITGNPIAAAVAGSLTLVDSAVNAGNTALRDSISAKGAEKLLNDANKRYENALLARQKANPTNTLGTSNGEVIETSGQSTGVAYKVFVKATYNDPAQTTLISNGGSTFNTLEQFSPTNPYYPFIGALGALEVSDIGNGAKFWSIGNQSTASNIFGPIGFGTKYYPQSIEIVKIERVDGQPELPIISTPYEAPKDTKPKPKTGNDPTSPDFFPWLPTLSYAGDNGLQRKPSDSPAFDNRPFKEPDKPLFAPPLAEQPKPVLPPVANTNPSFTAPSPASPASSASSNADTLRASNFDKAGSENYNRQPVSTAPTRSDISPSQAQNPLTNPLNPPVTAKPQTTPNTPNQGDSNDTVKILAGVAGVAATVTALKVGSDLLVNNSLSNTPKIDQIAQNTTNTNQQTNAKQGVCDAMQPQQCGFEGVKQATTEATNPIKDQTVANAGLLSQILAAIANLVSTLATLFSNVVGKLDGIKTFLEKVASAAKLDKIYNLLTFITVVHNAQMLSTSLATTLMDTLSLGLATFGVKDENDSPIDIQQIINKSTEDTVKSIIGVENYTTLSDRWKKAVRVYQAAANITYQVRSLWDSAKSLAELTGANVGKIGNALRRDGVVSENAYGAMADNPLMVNSAMTKLQNLEEAASHLNAITSEGYGITETVTQIKKDQDDFKKLAKEGTSSLNPIVNDQQKAKDDAAKIASISPSISTTDLSKP